MPNKQWTITQSHFLDAFQVDKLLSTLKSLSDRALTRGHNFYSVRDYHLIAILLHTGLRVNELTHVKCGDIQSNSLTVTHGKGKKTRTVLLTYDALKILDSYLLIKQKYLKEPTSHDSYLFLSRLKKKYTVSGVQNRVKYWFKELHLPEHLSTHNLRHTYISELLNANINLAIIRDNAGHSSINTTSRYLHATHKGLGPIKLYSR